MKSKLFRIAITLITLTAIASFGIYMYNLTNSSKTDNMGNGVISLEAPLFTSVAEASPAQDTKTFLEEEAGISAYTNVGQVDLTRTKGAYRTVEKETDEYTLGSMPVPNYDETQDAHVYVSKDGWVVAYYSKDDPVSKMVDSRSYDNTDTITTKLEAALGIMCSQLGKGQPDIKYYDFRCPDANKLMIIADKEDGKFQVKIPNDIAVSKMSWWNLDNDIRIDGSRISGEDYGTITPSQLSKGVSHAIGDSDGGIVFVYKEP